MRNYFGFTLMELMITVVLIGIIAGFAVPNYEKSIAKAHERDAINGLKMIYAAANLYKTNEGDYNTGNLPNTQSINTALNINLMSEKITYSALGGAANLSAKAYFGTNWIASIHANKILSSDNPCCELFTPCPSLPFCP